MSRENKRASWLVLAYRVAGENARLRASVWRRLRAAGAVYLVNSVAALPAAPPAERLLRRLRSDISLAEQTAGDRKLARLTRWNEQVRARDQFGARQAVSATAALAKCGAALDSMAGPDE